VTNITGETFVLYQNEGQGTFVDARAATGVAALTAASTGFGTDWVDYDNDGLLDLLVANGAVNVIESQRGQPRPFRMRNQLFHNEGKSRFRDATAAAGEAFGSLDISRGAAFGDVDNDGDVDAVVTTSGGAARLFLNDGNHANGWLQVSLRQPGGNRFAIGARVGVERQGAATLWRRVRTDGSYLSASDLRVHFGLGTNPRVDSVVVQWPDGVEERWHAPRPNRAAVLERGTTNR
jgi:hypothetical protein